MIPSFAFAFSDLPGWVPWVVAIAIGAALVTGWGALMLLRGFQELTTRVTSMVQRELAVAKERMQIDVQQPLVVKAHEPCVPIAKHEELVGRVDALKQEFDKRMSGFAEASAESREKMYLELREQGKALAKNTEKTDLTNVRVEKLDGKIDRILERLPRATHES